MDQLEIRGRSPELRDTIVWVRHGPVHHYDDASEPIESFPARHRAAAVPFVKRRRYGWQREYRFTVSINGRAGDDRFLLPISAGTRRFATMNEDPILPW